MKLTFFVNTSGTLCSFTLVWDLFLGALFVRVEIEILESEGNAGRKFAWEIPVVKLPAYNTDGYNMQCGIHGRVEGTLEYTDLDFACKA